MNAGRARIVPIQIGTADFETEVLRSRKVVVVAFVTPWSRPCQVLNALLDEAAVLGAGRMKIVKINADDNPDLSMWYEIQSVPTLLYFYEGALHARVVGTATKEAILAKVRSILEKSESPPCCAEPKPMRHRGPR